MKQLSIYDTTLRDGTQREGIALSLADKIKITILLDSLGVAYIEGGWPGSNPKDAAYFDVVRDEPLQHAKIAAFGSTCHKDNHPEDDGNIHALIQAQTDVVTVVGKSSPLHVEDVLQTTMENNLRMIRDSVAYLKDQGKEVIYDAEHFFDGAHLDDEYALATLLAALDGGADCLVLCDTNGGTLPSDMYRRFKWVVDSLPDVPLGIHTHNDTELAVANTLVAVDAGARHIQGTINGYGERCGNANLCSIIPNLQIKQEFDCIPASSLRKLTRVARTVAEIANLAPDSHAAYVGKSAFAHKGGIHVAAMRLSESSYQHINPQIIGNEQRTLVSDLSGRGNILNKAEQFGLDISRQQAVSVLDEVKQLENQGFVFEGAEASIAIRLYRIQDDYQPLFTLVDFTVLVDHLGQAQAIVKLDVGGEVMHTAADGNGPVNALDLALRKALLPLYPQLAEVQLADYKVRILNSESGTAAITRVLIDTQLGSSRWSTVGASANIIHASWLALLDSIEYGLCLAPDLRPLAIVNQANGSS